MDALMVNIKSDKKAGKHAVYSIIGVNCDGRKDCFGFWIGEDEGAHKWLSIFDELKTRGVERLGFVVCAEVVRLSAEIWKMIFTANAIESFNLALRKVTDRKAAFPNETAVMKILFLLQHAL